MQPKAGQKYRLVRYKVHSFGETTKVSAPWTAIHLSVMKWYIPNVKAFNLGLNAVFQYTLVTFYFMIIFITF